MIKRMLRMVVVCLCIALLPSQAWAHQLRAVTDGPLGPENAIMVDDSDTSQVVYHVASVEAPQLWITFQGTAGGTVHFETGVPYIERLKDERPIAVLIGPGLPEASLPFALPPGTGAIVYDTAGTQQPEVFNEEFTGTQSWQFGPWDPVLPQSGKYYLVVYLPSQGAGKFWAAIGEAESFGPRDILTLPQTIISVRHYHELSPWGGVLGWGLVALLAIFTAILGALFG